MTVNGDIVINYEYDGLVIEEHKEGNVIIRVTGKIKRKKFSTVRAIILRGIIRVDTIVWIL